LTNFDSPHEWNMVRALGTQPEAQRTRHGFRLMQGVVWESLLSDSLVFRTQAAFIMIPQRIYPAMCDNNPDTCNQIPASINTFPKVHGVQRARCRVHRAQRARCKVYRAQRARCKVYRVQRAQCKVRWPQNREP
jgi:hypothetical protein